MKQREKIVPLATGRVLDIGIGSGLNLPFYDPEKVEHLWGLDPSEEMWEIAKKHQLNRQIPVEYMKAFASNIPLDTDTIDSIVITYTLCTIPDELPSLHEIRRVMKPGGQLFFCEHGAAPDKSVKRTQDFINPIWKRLGGGCNLNKHIPSLIKEGGFNITKLETMYIPGWKPASFNYWGVASVA